MPKNKGNFKDDDIPNLISEFRTRKKFVDKQLEKVGWKSSYWKEEVNSVKSNFNTKDYVLFKGSVEKGVDRFIDYLLLDENDEPLAIVEAKKYSKDPEDGMLQARTYQEDIQDQTKNILPIFLTNGDVWIFIDEHGRERKVSGPFSQEDLSRRHDLFINEKDPSIIFSNIVTRDRSKLNVKKVAEHFAAGHRKALVQMATGTGKTRVSMAIIDILMKANYIRNVLFIVDRIVLADDAAEDGFKKYFKEPVRKLHREGFSTTARFYTTTVQTLMGKNNNGMVDKFSPGFFDLIIFDEAHRSQFDRNNYIHGYFDAIKLGLTATPRLEEDKNSYTLFDCLDKKPTVEYSYEDAVRDKVLVPYQPLVIETENLKIGIKGRELSNDLKTQLRKQEVDPEHFEVEGSNFEKVFLDDKTNELIVTEFMRECHKSGEGLPCKTIFFCRGQKHARRLKKAFTDLYPNLGSNVQVITSIYHAPYEVKRFKRKSEPRIALSVGMLDTGVDIPEVCNLVFIGPIFSPIRFWQMLGRGTRNFEACCAPGKHPDWLPLDNGVPNKKEFMLMDFQFGDINNIILHHLKDTPGREKSSKDILSVIFDNRVNLLTKKLNPIQRKIIIGKIMSDINALNEESFIVREKNSLIKKLRGTFDLEKYVKELHEEIGPMMIMAAGKEPKVTPFILQVEKLFYAIVSNKLDLIDKIKVYVQEKLENIMTKETRITEIHAKKNFIIEVLQDEFWDDLTFEKVEKIIKELAPLAKYYEEVPGNPIEVNKPDVVLARTRYVYEIKEDPKMAALISSNPIIKKIKDGHGVTCDELRELERELIKLNSSYSIETIQESLHKDFLIFLREIIGLSHEYDPKELIEREFDSHIANNPIYNSRQMEFLQLLKKVFANRKYIDLKDFAKEPFKDKHPIELFNGLEELNKIVAKCKEIKMK